MAQKTKFTHNDIQEYMNSFGCTLMSDEYINAKHKLDIKCKCGNLYTTNFDSFKFKDSTRCKECSNLLISKSKSLKYDYVYEYINNHGCELLDTTIKNATSKLKIKCSCGDIFYRSFNKFKSSNQTLCLKCKNIRIWDYHAVKDFINNQTNCKMLSKCYNNRNDLLDIKCDCGNNFQTTFHSFLYSGKRQCDKCGYAITSKKNKKGIGYIEDYVSNNSNSQLLSTSYKDYHERLDFKCKCGNYFTTSFVCFLNGKTKCNLCSGASKMEVVAEQYLIDNGIVYVPQYTFDDLRGVNDGVLRFDFAILGDNGVVDLLVELDGIQHFEPFDFFGGEEKLAITWQHDSMKNNYCKDNNISLLRIPYYKQTYIEEILNDYVNKYDNPVPSLI